MKFIVSLISFAAVLKLSASVVVQTQHGPVMGTTRTSDLGRSYYHFMGIPYARSPEGALMFRVSFRCLEASCGNLRMKSTGSSDTRTMDKSTKLHWRRL
jgi:carboxylesterase type B